MIMAVPTPKAGVDRTEINEVLLTQLREEMLGADFRLPQDFTQRPEGITQDVADSKSNSQYLWIKIF